MGNTIRVPGFIVRDLVGKLPVRPDAEPYPQRDLSRVTTVVIHYSGIDADSSGEAIAAYQVGPQAHEPFPEAAYTFVIRWDGLIEQLHRLETRTWHAGGLNNDFGIGICLPGLQYPRPAQLEAGQALIWALEDELGRRLEIRGHKELMATRCPGDEWDKWREELRPRDNLTVNGYTLRWGFLALWRRLERLQPGFCGMPMEEQWWEGDDSRQSFQNCEMRYSQGKVWVSFR